MLLRSLLFTFGLLLTASSLHAGREVQLAADPQLSPDGKTLLFAYRGDIWTVPTTGGSAERLTTHPATDDDARWSPDGTQIAFVTTRTGSSQVFTISTDGKDLKQLTFHTEGFSLKDWFPDGQSLLVSGSRDHFWRSPTRLMKISAAERSAEAVLFDGYSTEGSVSPDGKHVLFVREGERMWRKGYVGSRAAQIWGYNIETAEFTAYVDLEAGAFSPEWLPDGSGFLFCCHNDAKNGARNLWKCNINDKQLTQLTHFGDDLVMHPTVSRDGKTVVFAHLFDLYSMPLKKGAKPAKISIIDETHDASNDLLRRSLTTVSEAAFTSDGLEIAFVAGGDLWVMETTLKEPVQITRSAEFESDPIFIDDDTLLAVSWNNGNPDLMKFERADSNKYWWQNTKFNSTVLTEDANVESNVQLSPDGKHIAYIKDRGDLWIHDLENGNATKLVESFSAVSYDFSPDGKWITYARTDDDFNSDIWIVGTDAGSQPVNISRHPDDEYSPKWSSDGRIIAFSGRRNDDEVDIYYIYLREEDDDTGSRDRKLKETLKAFQKKRPQSKKPAVKEADSKKPAEENKDDEEKKEDGKKDEPNAKDLPEVKIDFKNIHRRLRTIRNPNSSDRALTWAPTGQKLLIAGSYKGESGTWTVEFPDKLTPKKLSSSVGSVVGWLEKPDRLLWVVSGKPAVQTLTGSSTTYSLKADQEISQSERYKTGFEAAWRVMRDRWYDDNFGNHNWDSIRRKYADAAGQSVNAAAFANVVTLMLGELNGSHLGFYPSDRSSTFSNPDAWRPVTAHPGVRFVKDFKGPGLKIKDVIPNGPAEDEASLLYPGEIILSIDGTNVDADMDLTTVLNGPLDRDLQLKVKAADKEGAVREVMLRPTTFGSVRSALYLKWQDDNRAKIAKKDDSIGYLHIRGMDWASFQEFERELYDVGYGKDGLVIDVRDNGGGFTTDHLLTALTQPRHSITVPRGGGSGYPQSRMVYATWDKPIVVLCNQNSYSNAEIFSHAIKGLGRGKLVGVQTAGGVVSTGSVNVTDVGRMRLPFRGWFVKWTGEDMEMNGAVPNVIVWPLPAELPAGRDRQLNRAVKVLQKDIKEWKAMERPKLKKVTER
ncbi:MAG: S41 family peptidase [Fuerstiella sp.]